MKICVLTTSYPRFKNDHAGNFIHNITKKLVNEGLSVIVVAPHDKETKKYEIMDGVEIYRFKYWFKNKQKVAYGGGIPNNISGSLLAKFQSFFFFFFFFCKALTLSKKSDIIHSHFLISGFIGIPIKLLFNKKLILTVHGTSLRKLPFRKFFSKFFKYFDKIISPHPELVDLLRYYNVNDKIIEIPNIIDFGKYEKEKPEVSIKKIKKEFNLKNEKIITLVCRFVDFHDPITMIRAIPEVIKENSKIKFFLIGDGPLINNMKKLIKKFNVESYIILTGFRCDVRRFLHISDVFVGISPVENIWSMSVVEAITLGVPCILSDVGYTNKYFTHLENAYLITSKDEKDLSKAIINLINSKEKRKMISKNAKKLLEKEGFSNKKIINKTIKLYKELIVKK